MRNAEVCKDRRRSGRTQAALRSINRRKTQDAESGKRRLPKMRRRCIWRAKVNQRMDRFPLICLSSIIGRRIKVPRLVKGATREPISVGRCQEWRLLDESMNRSIDRPSHSYYSSLSQRRVHFIHEMQIPETAKFAASKSRSERGRKRPRSVRSFVRSFDSRRRGKDERNARRHRRAYRLLTLELEPERFRRRIPGKWQMFALMLNGLTE